MLGGIMVKVAFAACLLSVLSYFQYHRRGTPYLLKAGRWFFTASVAFVLATAGILLSLILTHQFQYTYIWSYSSRELSTPLLISTFYAGQEGSFMLWTMYTALIGLALIRYSSTKGYEAAVMSVFGLIELSLLLMLIVKNPFLYVWESWPGQVAAGFMPANGRGLNPLLQNYWMVIHPQVLFSGFASMGVPFAYAVAALMKRDYEQWIRPATPWLVFGALVLGTGIMMGGFWAYETLGWGGYWGWDPVENSSLVPWLVSIAALHTTLSQRKSGAFIRTNLILGMLCFLMVLYSTFLTRSGVLGDTSVHSFVDPGMMVYWLLVGMIGLFALLGGGMYAWRFKELPRRKPKHNYLSREFALFIGTAALVVAALFITAGTSSPLITDILYGKKSAVDISYYVTTTLPIGILIGLLTGIGQLLWWTRTDKTSLLRNLAIPAGGAAAVTAILAIGWIDDLLVALFVYGAAFALIANIQVALRIVRGNPKFAGGSMAHIGLALMFFGFVASSKYDEKHTVSLPQGKPVQAMGYTMTYHGYRPIGGEKYAFHVGVEKEGRRFDVTPVMYYSSYSDGLMRNPDIVNLISKDFYLAPLSLEQKSDREAAATQKITLKKGEKAKVGDLEVRFVDFDFPPDQREAMMEGKEVRIGATLEVRKYGGKSVTLTPSKVIKNGQQTDEPARLGKEMEFTVAAMRPDQENSDSSAVDLAVKNLEALNAPAPDEPDVLVAEASVKPYINFVWSGVVVVLVGFLVTIVRRSQEARRRSASLTIEETTSETHEEDMVKV